MVRLYCLTRIYKTEANKYYYGEKVIPYSDGADENLLTGIKEEITVANLRELNFSRYYELTEICIGYKIVNDRKVYVMHFYRDDTRLCVFRMVRGAVRSRQATRNALDLTISTSTLFPEKIKTDLFMRIRWVKNTPTGTNIIDKEEERLYREFAEARKNEQIANHSGDDSESLFENIKLEMPNSSKANVLRTKMSRFLTLVKYLCDPNTGSYKNVPNDYEYNQQVKCFLAERSWKSEKPRKDELQKQAQNFRECREMHWKNLSMENQKLENFDPKYVMSANFYNVNIFGVDRKLFETFKNMFPELPSEAAKNGRPNKILRESNFRMLKHLTLISCYIEELTDEFLDILPKTLLSLCFNDNEITKISKKISEFTRLRDLELNDNKELGDFNETKKKGDTGFPWAFLPPSLVHLKLKRTNISIVPTEINRLKHLETLEISSKDLKKVEWFEISDTVVRLIIEGGNQLNEIELTSKLNLTTLHILQTGLTTIDCSKLPKDIKDFKMSNNKMQEFDPKNNLENAVCIHLINNGLAKIKWENLPQLLKVLYVERNCLTDMDDGILQLRSLTDILAGYNNIITISDKFWRLQQLTSLNLEHNELSALPRCFELLFNLRKLDLSHNKFNYQQTNLLENLWQRLPRNMRVLRLGGNTLNSLPCWLKKYNFTDLQVDDCKLSHICPNLYSNRQISYQNLNIERNKGIQFLPFIPSQIYHPNDENVGTEPNLTVFIDNEMLIGKPISALEPMYQFKKTMDPNFDCKCCASCGNETDEAVIEQLMIMDFDLKISKDLLVSTDVETSKDGKAGNKYKIYPADTAIAALPPPTNDLPAKGTGYSVGQWQTVVRTLLCPECLKILKDKIADSQNSNTKKRKSNENENEEINIPLSSHLLLFNSAGNESFLNATVNILDEMKDLRNIFSSGNSGTAFQNELSNVLQRKVNSVKNLRKLIPQYASNKTENVASELVKIFHLLNDEMKELLQFSYEKGEFCMCETRKSEGIVECFVLSISVGSMLTSFESFETMLNRWYKFESEFCFLCRRNTWQKSNHKICEKQKYFIIELDSWIKSNNRNTEQCRISSENFNIDSQKIFDKNWKLIAAIYGDSFNNYSTWRRFENKWIVIEDEKFKVVDKLLDDLKDYKIFLFERLEDTKEESNYEKLFELDQTMIKVYKNVTYSTFLQPQELKTVQNLLPQDSMEVDELYVTNFVDPHHFTTVQEQPEHYYDEFRQTVFTESSMTNATFHPNNNPTYYNPQQNFQSQRTYSITFEEKNLNNQNLTDQNHPNIYYPQNNFHPQSQPNSNYSQLFELYPINPPNNNYDHNMDTNFYPIQESYESSWFWNPQNEPL